MKSFNQHFLAIAFLVAVGCVQKRPRGVPSNFSRGSGDIGKFFVAEVQQYGGKPKATNSLPTLKTEWWYKTDDNGFQVLLDQTNRVQFQNLLQKAFGNPTLSTNYPQVLYKVPDIGVAIMCKFGTNNPLQVICLKAM